MAAEDRKIRTPEEVVAAVTCVEGVEKLNKNLQKWVGIPLSCPSLLDKLGRRSTDRRPLPLSPVSGGI